MRTQAFGAEGERDSMLPLIGGKSDKVDAVQGPDWPRMPSISSCNCGSHSNLSQRTPLRFLVLQEEDSGFKFELIVHLNRCQLLRPAPPS